MVGGNRPPTVLNVAEKPSVARALAAVFSRMPGVVDRGMRREEHQIFTHENVCFTNIFTQGHGRIIHNAQQSPHTMITTSVRGHLASTDFPPEYGWNKVDPGMLFEAPIRVFYRQDMEPLERMIRNLASNATAVILWLDCDREGEAIADEVREVCLRGNQRINVFRAKFSTVLPQEIQNALKSLGRINECWVQAVQSRMELDLRVGAAFTRFQTLRLQKKFDGFADNGVVSYGPCQFPTLGFVVERWARIETFIPEEFWYIELSLKITSDNEDIHENATSSSHKNCIDSRPIQFQWKRVRLYDQFLTAYLYEECLEAGEAVVTNVGGRPKNKWRPIPLATVDLQKRASRFLRIGSETLMTAAEELYQQGYISYPRTETEKFRPEFNHRSLIEQFTALQDNEFGVYANHLLSENNFQNPRAGQNDDQAHPPITPCKAVDPEQIGDHTQRSVYKLIVKHYLACCSRDAIGRETQLTVQMSSEEFTATGLMVLEKNWLEIYHPFERWGTGQGELPHVEIGSRVTPFTLMFKEGSTTPPLPITEVELITLMDRNGIGTDATIAQHITTIQEREYVTKDAGMRFHPTKLGIALVEAYNSIGYQLNKPDLRRETEAECNLVASGQKVKEEIMIPLLNKMKRCYQTTTEEADKLDQAIARHYSRLGANNDSLQVIQGRFSRCGICRNLMSLKQERGAGRGANVTSRKLLFCATCLVGYSLPRGSPIPKTQQQNAAQPFPCPICHFQVIDISRGDGYDGNGYSVCPNCFSHPPREHGGTAGGSDFRCFSCQHPTCTLASGTPGGAIEVFQCPFCNNNNSVCVKKNSKGFVLSCNKYVAGEDRCSYTIWLPKACQTVSVCSGDENNHNNICHRCSTGGGVVMKIKMVWRPGSLPPHMGPDCTACLLCDVELRRELEIALPQLNQVVVRQRNPTTGRGAGNNAGRGSQRPEPRAPTGNRRREQTGRGSAQGRMPVARGARGRGAQQNVNNDITCYKCGQPGHFANNCPSR